MSSSATWHTHIRWAAVLSVVLVSLMVRPLHAQTTEPIAGITEEGSDSGATAAQADIEIAAPR